MQTERAKNTAVAPVWLVIAKEGQAFFRGISPTCATKIHTMIDSYQEVGCIHFLNGQAESASPSLLEH